MFQRFGFQRFGLFRESIVAASLFAASLFAAGLFAAITPASAQGVLDEWASVKAPPPPPLTHVTLDPKTTALLVLDLAAQTCNAEQRPRCIAMLPRVKSLLDEARGKQWLVVYTLSAAGMPADILPPVAMRGAEPLVKGFPDKFVGTDLEKILRDHGIKTVVAVGAAAEGAVLNTVVSAVFRGFEAVVPVDGIASQYPFAEQYTIWNFANAPRLGDHIRLTSIAAVE